MIKIKKIAMRSFLVLELMAFGYIYMYGKNGMASLHKQRMILFGLEEHVMQIKNEIEVLEKEIYVWQSDDFYKEKIAREQLQMARKGDELYYIGV